MIFVILQARCAATIVKKWYGCNMASSIDFLTVFAEFASGNLDGNAIPNEYNNTTITTFVAASPELRFLIQIDSSLTVGEVVSSIGPYVEFQVSCLDDESGVDLTVSNAPSAFDVLMSSQRSHKHVPERYTSSLNKKLELKNAVIDWLVKNQVGWSLPNVQTLGISFVNTLTQVTWDLDGHHKVLARRSYKIPAKIAHLSGFNVPEKHKHKRKVPGNLTQNMVSGHSTALLNLTQLAYMKTDSWKGVYAILLCLAVNLQDYSKYLSSQNIAMQGHHNSKKTFSFSDCGAFDILLASSHEKTTP